MTTSNKVDTDVRYALYWQELFAYISTMTIKFNPFAEMMAKRAEAAGHHISSWRDNPYYQNICGYYSVFDTPMEIWSVEYEKYVTFDRDIRTKYPRTATFYYYGSDAYKRLCQTYPNQTGLITSIIYPVEDIDEAYAAKDISIVNHVPDFLRDNERESLYDAAREIVEYVRNRWFVYDYGHEDQYYLVFMSKLICALFIGLVKKRLENQDTTAVHHLHVWDRLEANGLGKYSGILTDNQARWFYRNMRYLKENRGTKSNLILLAENLLKNLKVHLVGKKIFQESSDEFNNCITVPEFLSEEIIDYSISTSNKVVASDTLGTDEDFISKLTGKNANSVTALVDMSSKESMDLILSRVHAEGYYKKYSIENSAEMEYQFGRTTVNGVPARLLELLKYTMHTPYLRHMTEFIHDTLVYQWQLGCLQYRLEFVHEETGLEIDIDVDTAMILLHYALYRRFGITPAYIPRYAAIHKAYKMTQPRPEELPTHFHFNGYNYQISTIIKDVEILKDIPWMNWKRFTTVSAFVDALSKQFKVMLRHLRDVNLERHLTFQWAMWYYYQFITVQQKVELRKEDVKYDVWMGSVEGISDIISTFDAHPKSKEVWDDFADMLISRLLPIEESEDMLQYAGAWVDNTKYYTKLKQLFQEWTSHDLTYLDTERANVTYIDMMPVSTTTSGENFEFNTEITSTSPDQSTHLEESSPVIMTDGEKGTSPVFIDSVQSETDESNISDMFEVALGAEHPLMETNLTDVTTITTFNTKIVESSIASDFKHQWGYILFDAPTLVDVTYPSE